MLTCFKEIHMQKFDQVCALQVADCVCLMSLDKHEAIPVDTHVWQLAARDYMPQLKNYKSLTDKLYNQIGKNFLFCNFVLMILESQ